jgi:DnaJ-class molecular chaperone
MSPRESRNARAMSSGQARWDNAAPPEDGPVECPVCNGRGEVPVDQAVTHQLGTDLIPGWDGCEACDGTGWIDENGQPFNPNETGE